jgi:serine/threonine protein kinase
MERPLGHGGMGSVFLATHLGTGRQVALKLISLEGVRSADFQSRFRREARMLGRLRHPNIVNITDFGVAPARNDDTAYLVMEYLDGLTLAAYQKEHASVPVRMILDVLDQVASALDAAHQAAIIHRDLKPENIWLQPDARGGFTAKVLDFGIAKMTEPLKTAHDDNPDDSSSTTTLETIAAAGATLVHDATVRGRTVGTPAYMSPEQCRGEPLDGRSDVYSLGVMTYSLLSGELPFSGTWNELLQKHVHASPPPLSSKRKGISGAVSAVVMSALEKRSELRPPSASAFVSRLRTAAELERSLLPRARMLASISAPVATCIFLAQLLFAVSTCWMALYAFANLNVPSVWRSLLAFITVIVVFMTMAGLGKAAWALVAVQVIENGPHRVRLGRVATAFLRVLPALLVTQAASLVRLPPPFRACLWPVVCVLEQRKSTGAVRRSVALTGLAQPVIAALRLREMGIAIIGATYGIVITPVMATGNFSDAGFTFFQSFCAFIMAVPLSVTTLATFTIAFFRCRHMLGETPEPVISSLAAPEFGNRIPAVSLQSKLWLACVAAVLIVAIYARQTNDVFDQGPAGERLLKAAEGGHIADVKRWLAANANPDAVIGGWSPLTRAVLFGQEAAVDLLLAAGANVNKQERHIGSALYLAVAGRRDQLTKKLLQHGADPNLAPSWGQTPLMKAATQGNTEMVRLLLDHGADPGRANPSGERASTFARREGHVELAERLSKLEKR